MAIIAGSAAAIGAWAGGAAAAVGASAAVAGTIATIAESVVIGVVTGAVIGAATSAITGGNILDGALKGAAIGGITAGVTTGLTTAFSGATEAAKGLETVNGIANGVPSGTVTEPLANGGTGLVDTPMSGKSALQAVDSSKILQSGNTSNAINTGTALHSVKDGILNKEVIAGGLEGAFSGLGQVAAAKMEGDSKEEQMRKEAEIAQQAKDDNQVGEFVARVANINVPDWWNKYIDPSLTNKQPVSSNGNQVNSNAQQITQAPTQDKYFNQGLLNRGAIA